MTFLGIGCEVFLVCRQPPADRYLGLNTVAARGSTGSRLRLLLSTPLLMLQALRLDADLYVLVNPMTLFVGLGLALAGRRVVYSTHEDFREKAKIRPHIPRGLRWIVGHGTVVLEQILSRVSVETIVTQPDIKPRYARSRVVGNAPLTAGPVVEEARRLADLLEPHDRPTLIYSGVMTRDRGLFRMLDLVRKLNEYRSWRLVLVGSFFPASEQARASQHPGWCFVTPVGPVSHAMSLAHISKADIGLGLLDDVAGYRRTSMTKLYEYMWLETPFVVSDFSRWRDSVRDAPAGLFVDPHDITEIARLIDGLVADPGRYHAMQRTGHAFVEQNFGWEHVSRPLADLIDFAPPASERRSQA